MSTENYGREQGFERSTAQDGLMEVSFGLPTTFDYFDVDIALLGLRDHFATGVRIEHDCIDHTDPLDEYQKFYVVFDNFTLNQDRIETLHEVCRIIEGYKEST